MPWDKEKDHPECPTAEPWGVVKEGGELEGCHATEADADVQLAALYASERSARMPERLRELLEHVVDEVQRVLGVVKREGVPDCAREAAGEEAPERAISFDRIWEQIAITLWDGPEYMWLINVYLDDGEMYAVAAKDGKLFRATATVEGEDVTLGEWEQVAEVHEPTGRTIVKRQEDGRYRWFAVSAAAVLNRVGEIDSMALFDSFEQHIAETGEWPTRDFWHYDGEAFEIGQSDFVARDGALLLTSGLYHETPLAEAVAQATIEEPEWWGDSIYFSPTAEPEMVEIAEGVRVPVYTAGELRRIASCKEAVAGSLYTRCVTHREVNRMRAEVLETLEKLRDEQNLDVDVFDELVALADGTNRAISETGVVVREDPEPQTELPAEFAEQEGEFVLSDELVDEVVSRAFECQQFAELRTELAQAAEDLVAVGKLLELSGEAHKATEAVTDGLAERLVALERDDEEKLEAAVADLPASRRRKSAFTYRPREQHRKGAAPATLADTAEQTLDAVGGYPTR